MAAAPNAQPPAPAPGPGPRVVETADELQEATRTNTKDIEIHAHLDLRTLEPVQNPELKIDEANKALLYVGKHMKSMRGNCSDPAAVAALNLTTDEANLLLPLKPRQCLLLLPNNFIVSNGGSFWLDNLYLRLATPRSVSDPYFISAGPPRLPRGLSENITPAQMYITNVTMDAHLWEIAGVYSDRNGPPGSLLVQDCIFTSWNRQRSPIYSAAATIVNVVNTVFHNMRLPVEIADVSWGGFVRFQNASLANVTLTQGRLVSTTLNDGSGDYEDESEYYSEDDKGFDVEVARADEPGILGVGFTIENANMSDCIWLGMRNDSEANVGCPPESVERREAVRQRSTHPDGEEDGVWKNVKDQLKKGGLLNATSLQKLRQELGELHPPPPTWPPFAVHPRPKPDERVYITEQINAMPSVALVPVWDPTSQSPGPVPPHTGRGGAKGDGVRVNHGIDPIPFIIAVCVVVALIAGVAVAWAAREVRRLGVPQQRRSGRKVESGPDPLRTWLNSWLSDGMEPATARDTDAVHASSGAASMTTVDSPPRQQTGAQYGSYTLPQSALNPEYEYALPTEIARMMGAPPQLETVDEGLRGQLRASGVGDGGSSNDNKSASPGVSGVTTELQLPNIAATQPVLPVSAFDFESSGSRKVARTRSAERGWPGNNAYTAPLGGATTSAMLEGSLMALSEYDSDAPGSTVVVAPYEMQTSSHRTGSTHSMHSVHSTQSVQSTQMNGAAPEIQVHVRTTHGMHVNSAFNTAARRVPSRGSVMDLTISEGSEDVMAPMCSGWTSGTLPTPAEAPPAVQGVRLGRMHELQDRSAELGECSAAGTWPSANGDGAGESVPTTAAKNGTQATATTAAGPTIILDLPRDRLLARLQRQMDRFGRDDVFLGRFELLGRRHQRRGGQALVQFAEDPDDHGVFAVKFFLDWDAFLTEAALYATAFPSIRNRVSASVLARVDAAEGPAGGESMAPMSKAVARFLPQVEAVCDGTAGGLVDPRGRPLPPCIVLEKGEALHDWSDRAQPDIFTSLSVMSNLSKRLADMHDTGYVHRDLKPGNVMWLPRQNRWTVIDFGCVAKIGEDAPLTFTLAYAAPEVVRAYFLKQREIKVTPALDAWSLGVMAFELLMGAPAFNLLEDGSSGVMRRLRGDMPLPWEGELSTTAKRKLGAFRQPVLQLLQREPGRRSTMRTFHTACNTVFARTTMEA